MKLKIASLLFATAVFSSCCEKSACPASENIEPGNQAVRLNVFFTPNENSDINEIKAVADSLVSGSRTDAGCIYYDFLESTTTPGMYMIIETWENDSVLDIHSRAPHFEKYVPMLQALGTMSAERFYLSH